MLGAHGGCKLVGEAWALSPKCLSLAISTSLFCCSKWSEYYFILFFFSIKNACPRRIDNVDELFLVIPIGKLHLPYMEDVNWGKMYQK